MNARRRATSKSTRLAEIALVVFVAFVLVALYYSYLPGTTSSTQSTAVSLQNLTLFSGSPSIHSLNSSCFGDAILEVVFVNPSSNTIHVSNVVIYGSGLAQNATTLVTVSNSCLSLTESNPAIDAGSSYTFDGYVNTPLPFGSTFNYLIELDNGQTFSGILQAQT